jgi:hypothetical protein
MKLKLKGAGVALITPFKKDFSIDFEAIERLVEYQMLLWEQQPKRLLCRSPNVKKY